MLQAPLKMLEDDEPLADFRLEMNPAVFDILARCDEERNLEPPLIRRGNCWTILERSHCKLEQVLGL